MFTCLQWNVFYIETNKMSEYGGDDNRSIYTRLKSKIKNPQSDFLSYKEWVDVLQMFTPVCFVIIKLVIREGYYFIACQEKVFIKWMLNN